MTRQRMKLASQHFFLSIDGVWGDDLAYMELLAELYLWMARLGGIKGVYILPDFRKIYKKSY